MSKTLKELFLDTTNETAVIQTHIYNEIWGGAKKWLAARNAVPVIKLTSGVGQVNADGAEADYAPTVAQGGEIPINWEALSTNTITAFKIGTRPVITEEMVEDALWDQVSMQLRKAGRRIAIRENMIVMRHLRYNTAESTYTVADSSLGNNVDCVASLSVAEWNTGISYIEADGFKPDTAMLHPAAVAYMRGDTTGFAGWLYTGPQSAAVMSGESEFTIGKVNATMTNVGLSSSANEIMALTLAKDDAGVLAERRALTVKNYQDPIRDLVGISVTQRLNAALINSNAVNSYQV